MKFLNLLILILFSNNFFAQNLDYSNLFYSNKTKTKGLYILDHNKYLVINSIQNSIIWLLNNKKEIIDSTQFLNRNNTYLQNLIITSKNSFSINSLQGSAKYIIKNNKLTLKEGICFFSNDKKNNIKIQPIYENIKNPMHATMVDNFQIVLDWSFVKSPGIYCCVDNKAIEISSKKNIKKVGLSLRERRMQSGFGEYYLDYFWKYIYNKNRIFINSSSANVCYIFDCKTKTTKTLKFPELKKEDKAFWFYMYDHIEDKDYAFKLMKEKDNEVYSLDIESGKMNLVAKTEHKIENIVDGKMQIMALFEGVWSHFLVPFKADNQKNIKIEEITVN